MPMTAQAAQSHPHPRPREVEILVNHRAVTVPRETTGAEIKRLAGVPADFELFVVRGDEDIQVKDDEIKVHPQQRFTASSTLDPS